MDNLTHSLTGLALARAGLNRVCPRAVWLLLLSANAPDLDIVAATQGGFRYLEIHRGYSHSLICLPAIAAIAVLLVAAAFREKLPWIRAWLVCVIGLASHLLLDWTNSYGIRLLLPFSSRWFHLDVNSLYDAWILAALLFAAVWPPFVRLVNREIGETRSTAGVSSAVVALAFFFLFDTGRAILHNRAVAQMEARLYDGAPPLTIAALPDALNPLRWTGVIETADNYHLLNLETFASLNMAGGQVFHKPPRTPAVQAAEAIEPFRYFLYFARFPVWSQQPVLGARTRGLRIELTDLRFGEPGAGSFHCIAYENERHQVLRKWFTYGSGTNLGWGESQGSADPAR